MNRRDLILLLSGAMTAAPVLRAQQKTMPVIGWLGLASGALFSAAFPAFREGLASQGYVEGEDVAIVFRWAGGDVSKLLALAAELVAMPVDVIVATGGPVSNAAAQLRPRRSRSSNRVLPDPSRTSPGRMQILLEWQTKPQS